MASISTRRRPIGNASEIFTLILGLGAAAPRQSRICRSCRNVNTAAAQKAPQNPSATISTVNLRGKDYQTDSWHNLSSSVTASIGRNLYLQKDHPISITRQIIESRFPSPIYKYHNALFPVVSTHQNFDSLGFPHDHPGRSKTDTYYVNKDTVLRTHTSAHQADTFRANASEGYLISADVYRRDEIDRSHYPVFHQMEGARMWDRSKVPGGDIAKAVYEDLARLPTHDMKVEDPNPPFHDERNPLQESHHSAGEAEAIAAHLKRSLELMVVEIFSRARAASSAAEPEVQQEPLRVRWIEAYFPFTSPSWELEIFWQGDWLEVLGCGVVKQDLLISADVPSQLGWAFGIGLERIAMLLFEIPDIRLFWSQDERFLGQFKGVSDNLSRLKKFAPFSKHPACFKDVSFWVDPDPSSGERSLASSRVFHENDLMEIVRDICGETVEDVKLVDSFTHPKSGRKSLCYRINYRSLERTLTNRETNEYDRKVKEAIAERLAVELR